MDTIRNFDLNCKLIHGRFSSVNQTANLENLNQVDVACLFLTYRYYDLVQNVE